MQSTFENIFDFYLADHYLKMLKLGYTVEQMKIDGVNLMFDFEEAIGDREDLKKAIKEKIERTIEIVGGYCE